jgi:hypothetical protein
VDGFVRISLNNWATQEATFRGMDGWLENTRPVARSAAGGRCSPWSSHVDDDERDVILLRNRRRAPVVYLGQQFGGELLGRP